MPPKPNLSFSGLEEFMNEPIVCEPKAKKPVVETSEAKTSADKPKAVRKNNGALRFLENLSVNTARQVNIAHSKTTVNAARPKSHFSKTEHSIVKRPIHKKTTFKNSNFNQRVNTVKDKNVNVARPKAVINAVKRNQVNVVKASACWVWKLKTKVIDHVSRHNRKSLDQRVKVIRCDSGTEFKNKEMNQFCKTKGKQSNGNAGTKACDDAGKARMESVLGKDYILLPLWTSDPPFSQISKSSPDARFKPSSDDGKKVDEDSRNSEVNTVCGKTSIELPDDPSMPELEDYSIFRDDEDVGAEADCLFGYNYPCRNILNYKEFMDVKSAFLYGKIEEEVYVCQPPGFEDPDFPDRVYKVEKVLYGLHQALKAWYETLSTYLLHNGFQRGNIDKTLFIRRDRGDILLVQVYVDDIIFGSTKKSLCTEFEKMMHKKFQMSSMGELTFFLGLQVKHK
ncbi:putative ribonuclease H-like domain-containing protein [Tanacetum coccineum]